MIVRIILSITCSLIVFGLRAQQSDHFVNQKHLDLNELNTEQLHHDVIKRTDGIELDYTSFELDELKKTKLNSLLHAQYPELDNELQRTEKRLLQDTELSTLIAEFVQQKSTLGLLGSNEEIKDVLNNKTLSSNERLSMQFFVGYELFKKKQFDKAQKHFKKVVDKRNGPYAYAAFYSAIGYILKGEHEKGHEQLMKVRKEPNIAPYLPYYLALTHFGKNDFKSVTKHYANRLNENSLYEKTGLTKLVAWSYYHQNEWTEANKHLINLKNRDQLNESELLGLAIVSRKDNNPKAAIAILTSIQAKNEEIAQRSTFELGLAYAANANDKDAITQFESIQETDNQSISNEVTWNLALLKKRTNDYKASAELASMLINTSKGAEAKLLLKEVFDNGLNSSDQMQIVQKAKSKGENLNFINEQLYADAIIHVKAQQFDKAQLLFNQIKSNGVNASQQNNIDLWNGIISYHQKKYDSSIAQLTTALRSRPSTPSKLVLDAEYILGYIHFKQKNIDQALGHFASVYGNLKIDISGVNNKSQLQEDVLLRLGDIYFLRGSNRESDAAYKKAEKLNGRQADYSLYQQAIIADLANRPYDQLILLERIFKQYPDSKYKWKAKFKTANTMFALGKFEKAAKVYQSLLRSSNDLEIKEEATIQLGLISVNAGDYAQAESHYKTIIEQSESKKRRNIAESGLKEIYADYTHNTDEYLALSAKKNGQKGQSKDELLFALASKNLEEGNTKQATEQLEKLVAEYQESPFAAESFYELTKLSVANKDHTTAAQYLKEVFSNPDQAEWQSKSTKLIEKVFQYSIMGRNWILVNELANIEDLNSAILLSPKLIYYTSVAEFNADKLEPAANRIIDNYALLLDHPAWLAKSIILLSDIHFMQGDSSSAVAALRALMESKQDIPESLKEQAKKRLSTYEL